MLKLAPLSCAILLGLGVGACRSNPPADAPLSELAVSLKTPALPEDETKDVPFQFCPLKKSFSMVNNLWLSYIASSEYSHYRIMGPQLEELGFGDPGDGKIFLKYSYIDRLKRIEEKDKNSTDTWRTDKARLSLYETIKSEYKNIYNEDYVPDSVPSFDFEKTYLKTPNDRKIQFVSGDSHSRVFSKSSSQAVYAEHPGLNFAVLSFRGTEFDETLDWLADLKAHQVPLEGMGKIHEGFAAAFTDLEPQVFAILKSRSKDKPLNLWLTGHSLGASLATIMAAKIMMMHEKGELLGVNLIGMYTIGSPRVGDLAFAQGFDAMATKQAITVVRTRVRADVVTMVPPNYYWHVGTLAYVGTDGVLYFRDGWREIEAQSDYPKMVVPKANDHLLIGYWRALKKAYLTYQGKELSDCTLLEPNAPPALFYEDKSMRK